MFNNISQTQRQLMNFHLIVLLVLLLPFKVFSQSEHYTMRNSCCNCDTTLPNERIFSSCARSRIVELALKTYSKKEIDWFIKLNLALMVRIKINIDASSKQLGTVEITLQKRNYDYISPSDNLFKTRIKQMVEKSCLDGEMSNPAKYYPYYADLRWAIRISAEHIKSAL